MKKLIGQQHRAMRLYHLGGIEAWRDNGGASIKCNTVNALIKKGLFTKSGLTKKGTQYIAQYASCN